MKLLLTAAALALAAGCAPPLSIAMYKREDDGTTDAWCEQFCVTPPLIPEVKQFGDVSFGRCDKNGYPFYDHSETFLKVFKVDLYRKQKPSNSTVAMSLSPAFGDLAAACRAFEPDTSLNGSVTWDESHSVCSFQCAAKDSLSCMTCPDGIISAFSRADAGTPLAKCTKTMKPSEDNPDVVTDSCPEWQMELNMHGTGKIGGMTVEVDVHSQHSLAVLRESLTKGRLSMVV
eukprot:TRINITY_DN25362_c0_g2_i1.p1 TRINITY_DN25362_c0_g2~~TRINITY_DN25362_c0_g2_i1.p1  ORF type:complete len:231 (-),score=43.49 TRINITY_DN25362_c0_g2_i1:166-858(-)